MATYSANEGSNPGGPEIQGVEGATELTYEEAQAKLERIRRSDWYQDLPEAFRKAYEERASEQLTAIKSNDIEKSWRDTLPEGGIQAADAEMFSLDSPELQQYAVGDPMEAAKAAWLGAGDSQYGDIALNPGARTGMIQAQDYFSNLVKSGGKDAQSEAEYARRVEQAERLRRGEADAAVRALETQGRGGSGASLLANVVSGQGAANDAYQAGMAANALAQGRRDQAASAGADVARMRGDAELAAANARASGMDAWAQWNASSDWSARNADAERQQSANANNYSRQNSVNDANVDAANDRAWWEGPGKAQELWNRQTQALAGATGQVNLGITNERADQAAARARRKSPSEMIGGAVDTAAKVYGTVYGK